MKIFATIQRGTDIILWSGDLIITYQNRMQKFGIKVVIF